MIVGMPLSALLPAGLFRRRFRGGRERKLLSRPSLDKRKYTGVTRLPLSKLQTFLMSVVPLLQ